MKKLTNEQRIANLKRLLGFTDHVKVASRDNRGNISGYRLTWYDPAGQEAIIDVKGEIIEFTDCNSTYYDQEARLHRIVIDDQIVSQVEIQETVKGYFRR